MMPGFLYLAFGRVLCRFDLMVKLLNFFKSSYLIVREGHKIKTLSTAPSASKILAAAYITQVFPVPVARSIVQLNLSLKRRSENKSSSFLKKSCIASFSLKFSLIKSSMFLYSLLKKNFKTFLAASI
ncbi:hypothetical protein ES703_68572 [subsurface metagenome]